MPETVFKGTYSNRKHMFDVHFPAKIRSAVPSTTAASGVRADEAADLKKGKLYVGVDRSMIPITSSDVVFCPMKYRVESLRPKVPTVYIS